MIINALLAEVADELDISINAAALSVTNEAEAARLAQSIKAGNAE